MYGPPLDVLRTVLDRGQAESVVRPDIERIDLYVSIGALGYDYVLDQSTLNAIVAVDLMTPSAIDRRLVHITEMMMACCVAVPEGRAVSR